MPGCPFRNFEECPEHNKNKGCNFWISYTSSTGQVEGCAITLTPMLLVENFNALGLVAGEVKKVSAEVSAGRGENISEAKKFREQLVYLANGGKEMLSS